MTPWVVTERQVRADSRFGWSVVSTGYGLIPVALHVRLPSGVHAKASVRAPVVSRGRLPIRQRLGSMCCGRTRRDRGESPTIAEIPPTSKTPRRSPLDAVVVGLCGPLGSAVSNQFFIAGLSALYDNVCATLVLIDGSVRGRTRGAHCHIWRTSMPFWRRR